MIGCCVCGAYWFDFLDGDLIFGDGILGYGVCNNEFGIMGCCICGGCWCDFLDGDLIFGDGMVG